MLAPSLVMGQFGYGPVMGNGFGPGPRMGNGFGPGPGWNGAYGPRWANQGTCNVMACGYDARGVWRVLPLFVQYRFNGVQYDVTVINAWNPWTQTWNSDVDMPAYNTSYYLRGVNYDFYTPLSTGTYYFNL